MPSDTTTTSTSANGYSYATAGIQAISSVLTAALSVEAFRSQQKAKTDAIISNMDGVLSSYEYKSYKLNEDADRLDRMYANKISETTLDTLKKASYAKVAAAETGTSGGSTNEAITETYVNGQFNVAVINAERALQNTKLQAEAEASKINAVNSLRSLASGGTAVKADMLLSSLAGFNTALGNILTTMPNDVRASMFASMTSGKDGVAVANTTKPIGQ